MVLHIIFGGDFVADATGHRYGTQPGGTDERIDFLLAEQVEDFHHGDAGSNGQRKGEESADDDAYRLHVEERIHGHGTAYAEAQEDGSRVHDGVGSRIEQARSVGTDFFQQVTEHQHTDEGYCRGDEQGYYRRNGNREDDSGHAGF